MNKNAAVRIDVTAMVQVNRVVALIRHVLGSDATGVYLHGSAIRGGLRPHSDLDILAVCKRRLIARDRRQLVDGLLSISSVDEGRRAIELTIVAQSEIKPWRHPARREFQYGEWLRGGLEAGDLKSVAPTVDPDLTLMIEMVLDASIPLLGPTAQAMFEPIQRTDITAALLDELPAIVRWTETDTTNALLTLARIWCTVSTGRFYSKSDAAEWALERLPTEHQAVLTQARDVYLGDEQERWDGLAPTVQLHSAFVVSQIRAVARQDIKPSASKVQL